VPILSAPPASSGPGLPVGMRLGHTWARLGDIVVGEVDANHVAWVLTDLDGWWDSPEAGGTTTNKPTDHGVWAGPAYMTGRTIRLTITISAPDEERRDVALAQLEAAVPFTPTARLVVDSKPQPTWALVRRTGQLLVDKPNPRTATAQVSLLAPDARRYGLYPATGEVGISTGPGPGLTLPITLPIVLGSPGGAGHLLIDNIGSMPAPWTAIITGPVTNPRIVNDTTGAVLELSLTLRAGEYLRLDASTGQVRDQAGGDRSGWITYGTDWWLLAQGRNAIRFAGTTTGHPRLSMTAYPCWS